MRLLAGLLLLLSVVEAQQRGVGYTPPPPAPRGGVRGIRGGGWIPWGWGGGTNVTVVTPNAEKPKPASPLVVSPNYQADRPKPEMREYDSLPAPGPVVEKELPAEANAATVYLIAFRAGGGVESVYTYWIENNELHFVTTRNDVRSAPLAKVDRTLTELLNRKRNVEFRWP